MATRPMRTAVSLEQAHNFKTTFRNRTLSYLLRPNHQRAPGTRRAPEKITLGVLPGATPSTASPVRIFVGTEPAQFRAERVFVWSIMQHRDPGRVYEIYLMKDLAGFDRHNWKTGFTCYRYAIPALAGGHGRAIYNDVDQMYLGDPAELFDMDMHGKGMLGINERETSVMLLDCEKMIRIWHLAEAQQGDKHKPFRAAVHGADLWGKMPGVWNARDGEYVAGASKVLHFTTLQTQPWRPFPHDLRYQPHPLSELWHSAEREADAARFTLFTKERPSQRYNDMIELNRAMHANGHNGSETADSTFRGKSIRKHIEIIAALIQEHDAQTVLDYGSGKAVLYTPFPGEPEDSRFKTMPAWNGAKVTCYDPCYERFAGPIATMHDGVVCTDVLEHIADDDIPWVLDELFSHARRFVYAVAACYPARKNLPSGENAHVTLQPPHWWREQMAAAGRRHPHIEWVLTTETARSTLGVQQRGRGGAAATEVAALSFDALQFDYEPYPIGLARNVFPASVYTEMVDNFPAASDFVSKSYLGMKYSLSQVNNRRAYLEFVRSHPVWQRFYEYVKSPSFIADTFAVLRQHGIDLSLYDLSFKQRMRERVRALKRGRPLPHTPKLRARFEFSAMPSTDGCIRPHTDHPAKIITMVIPMLRPGEWNPQWGGGTSVVWPIDPAKSFNPGNDYLNVDEVRTIKTFAFEPNRCIVFIKTPNSWHMVAPMTGTDPSILRKTLTINIESS